MLATLGEGNNKDDDYDRVCVATNYTMTSHLLLWRAAEETVLECDAALKNKEQKQDLVKSRTDQQSQCYTFQFTEIQYLGLSGDYKLNLIN